MKLLTVLMATMFLSISCSHFNKSCGDSCDRKNACTEQCCKEKCKGKCEHKNGKCETCGKTCGKECEGSGNCKRS